MASKVIRALRSVHKRSVRAAQLAEETRHSQQQAQPKSLMWEDVVESKDIAKRNGLPEKYVMLSTPH